MKYLREDVKPIKVTAICDVINEDGTSCDGELKNTGLSYLSNPPVHQYECTKCGKTYDTALSSLSFIDWVKI